MSSPHLSAVPDPATAARLRAGGLEPRVVASSDTASFDAWLDVVRRGFLGGDATDEERDASRGRLDYRRKTGIYDPSAPVAEAPVATLASWISELSVPGGRGIPSCAISSVTVSPTHRRRGLARALVEGELAVAASQGVPMAMLTVSESPLYGRYGFGPAATSAAITLDAKRASWTGPVVPGRVDFIPRERLRELAPTLHDRVRLSSPGELEIPGAHWDNMAGTRPDSKDARERRAVQYTDEAGEVRGLALYAVRENDDDFTKAFVSLHYLLAETPDAYAALWRFFVELDLIGTVEAHEQAVDEPIVWMISDQRAATVTLRDHQYLRILDLPTALEARTYGAAGTLVLEVSDPLGYTSGEWLLEVDADRRGRVSRLEAGAHADAARVRLGVSELSAAYLGGVSIATLAVAGRVEATDAVTATRILSWHVTPRLSFWY